MSAPVRQSSPIVMQGQLGWVRKGAVESRYFVLRPDSLDYYANKDEADKGGPVSGCLLLDDIEELDMTETGFKLGIRGNRFMELQVMEDAQLQTWMDALMPFFENDSEEEEEEEDGAEVEEEVVHDASLILEIHGKRQQKHLWLFNDRLEYTETEEDQVPQDSYPLERLTGLKVLDTGFELKTLNRALVVHCERKESKEWISHLQQAYQAHMAELHPDDRKKQLLVSTASATPSATETTVASPDAAAQISREPKPSITPAAANDASQATMQPLYQGELGVLRSGNEESRYFVLFQETLQYWSTKADFLRGDKCRGQVVNSSVTNLEASDRSFTIFLDTRNLLELRCKTPKVIDTWLDHWSSILGKTFSRVVDEQPVDQDRIARNLEPPMQIQPAVPPKASEVLPIFRDQKPALQIQPAVPPKALEVVSSAPQSPLSPLSSLSPLPLPVGSTSKVNATTASQPAPSSPPSKLNLVGRTPDLPGLIFSGSLLVNGDVKSRRRHFALFDNRLDYFVSSSDLTGDRYPRGRILLRDITALDVLDDGFQLNFSSDMDVTKMVLVAEPSQLHLWLAAWNKTSLLRAGLSPRGSPSGSQRGSGEGKLSSLSPGQAIKDALIEGQLGLIRQGNKSTSKFSGKPEPRYFVLFPDRLDCFIDEANAKRGRALESVLRADIEDIDVVQDGFNIVSVCRTGRPLRLRALPGVQPSTEKWIEAFKKAFSK